MGKVKWKKKSLKWDFVKYFVVCTIFIFIGSLLLGILSDKIIPNITDGYIMFIGDGGNINVIKNDAEVPNEYILDLYIVELFQWISISAWSLLCIVMCGALFYHRKIKKPIAILMEASENISNNRLDFSVEVQEQNELGNLGLSFEKMREVLSDNFQEMWRQIEERKRLNAAFAHDLRTPLTVLKGQSEMIVKYAPQMSEEKIVATAKVMERHIARLEAYVNRMTDLQRLEDIEIQKQAVSVNDFVKQMKETGSPICTGKEFCIIKKKIPNANMIKIDLSVVMRVYENLIANAIRFANNKITVTLTSQDKLILLSVEDDGIGFTERDLSNATKPFYKVDAETDSEHLGMGLNICKILCEKHGGYLNLSNDSGAKVIAAFRQ